MWTVSDPHDTHGNRLMEFQDKGDALAYMRELMGKALQEHAAGADIEWVFSVKLLREEAGIDLDTAGGLRITQS